MTVKNIMVSSLLALASCGHQMTGVNWQNHVTMRTCVGDADSGASQPMRLCSGYSRAQDAVGAVTDVHYVAIQIERVFFRDLPTWTHDSDVSIDVTIRGLLPGGREYHQVLDIVHVKREAYLQIQNVGINFPIRFENRTVSLQFSVRALNDPATVKKLFTLGQAILQAVKSSSVVGGFLGANLVSEITEDIYTAVADFFTTDGHVFALKQVDFLPVANTTGTQEQLLFTEGRYLVVAVPPADSYETLRRLSGAYPELIDTSWLEKNADYKGGYVVMKGGAANYTYTPYIAFNFAVMKRYADRSVVVEGFKAASRAMDLGQLDAAAQSLALASANFMADTGFSFKKALAKRGEPVEGKGRRGLLEIPPAEIMSKIEPVMEEARRRPLAMLAGIALTGRAPVDLNALTAPPTAAQPDLTSAEPAAGIYTEVEYSLFMDLLKALGARLAMLKAGGKPTHDTLVRVLELHLAVKLRNPDLPLFNSECEVLKRSIADLWGEVKTACNVPASMKVQAGTELSDALKGTRDAETKFNPLIRLQKDVDFVTAHCLEAKTKAN